MKKIKGITSQDYHKSPELGSSNLKDVLSSIALYEHKKAHPEEPTTALRFGTLAHTRILEPDRFFEEVVVAPPFDKRTTKYKEFVEAHPDKIIISQDEQEQLDAMFQAVHSHPICQQIFSEGEAEVSYFWNDPETGLPCKGRPDWLIPDFYIIDLKTTTDASLEAVKKSMINFKYPLSCALYKDGVSYVEKIEVPAFIFVFVEKEPPYNVGVYQLDFEAEEKGRREYRTALEKLKVYQDASDVEKALLRGYPVEIQTITLPRWA